jgi:hypothetical protein
VETGVNVKVTLVLVSTNTHTEEICMNEDHLVKADYVLDGSPESVAIVREARGLAPLPSAEKDALLHDATIRLDEQTKMTAKAEASAERAWARHRDLVSRLGFGDDISEPMADNDTIVEFVDRAVMEASEHHECPIICERCGEKLAATICDHCHGSGGNNALIEATLAYSECEWCAGAGKVHVGCVERSYAELAATVIAPVATACAHGVFGTHWVGADGDTPPHRCPIAPEVGQ